MLNKEEQEVLDLSAKLWNAFLELPILHPDDQSEFRFNLHALQRIVLARPYVAD